MIQTERWDESPVLTPVKRQPKGRKHLKQLLEGIVEQEIAELNTEGESFTENTPQGKEVW